MPSAEHQPGPGKSVKADLLVIFALLGLMAAFALPRISPVEKRSREAEATVLAGDLRSAAASAHGLSIATHGEAQDGPLAMRGTQVTLVNGYPSRDTVAGLLQGKEGFVFEPEHGRFVHAGAPLPGACAVIYREAADDGMPPKITLVLSGC